MQLLTLTIIFSFSFCLLNCSSCYGADGDNGNEWLEIEDLGCCDQCFAWDFSLDYDNNNYSNLFARIARAIDTWSPDNGWERVITPGRWYDAVMDNETWDEFCQNDISCNIVPTRRFHIKNTNKHNRIRINRATYDNSICKIGEIGTWVPSEELNFATSSDLWEGDIVEVWCYNLFENYCDLGIQLELESEVITGASPFDIGRFG